MNQGMRVYIKHLERDIPSHVIRVKEEVSPEFEIPAILTAGGVQKEATGHHL